MQKKGKKSEIKPGVQIISAVINTGNGLISCDIIPSLRSYAKKSSQLRYYAKNKAWLRITPLRIALSPLRYYAKKLGQLRITPPKNGLITPLRQPITPPPITGYTPYDGREMSEWSYVWKKNR